MCCSDLAYPAVSTPSAPALRHGPQAFGYTTAVCSAACPSFVYFALQAGSWCFCDNGWAAVTQYGAGGGGGAGGRA